MANHTFHLTRHANSPLYEIISSPFFRLLHLALICLSILLFGAGIGLASKYVPVDPGFLDLGISSDFAEKLAMGILFMSLIWSIFLLAWHLAKRPKIHPGYYIGFDFYVFVSMVVALSMAIALSATVEYDLSICDPTSSRDHQSRPACEDHVEQIKGLDITAYILAFLASIAHFVYFVIACRCCTVYDREKMISKALAKRGMEMEPSNGSHSKEQILPRININDASSSEHIELEFQHV